MPSTIFIDATPDHLPLWRQVHRDSDPAIAINMVPVAADQVPTILEGYDTCIVDATYFPRDQLERCRGLRHIVFLGTGAASYIDLAAAKDLGIKVSTISGYGDTTVAEHAIGLMFAAARQTAKMDRSMRAGTWIPSQGMQLFGKTLGVVGLGGIGREMARLGRGIGMDVLAWNRTTIADPPVPLVDLDELLQRADVVSLHLSLNDATRGFMNSARLGRMKPDAILINTARGAIVDQAALVECLASGRTCRHRRIRARAAAIRRSADGAGKRHALSACRLLHARGDDGHAAPFHRPGGGRLLALGARASGRSCLGVQRGCGRDACAPRFKWAPRRACRCRRQSAPACGPD